jgi:Kef-type K+ transport system membrane component KefB
MLMLIAFVLIMFFVVKRILEKFLDKGVSHDGVSQWVVVVVLLTVFLTAFATEMIGVHAIFGAFVTGLIIPRKHDLKILLTEKIEDLVSVVLLPVYFTLSGLKTNLGLMNSSLAWGYFVLIILVSMLGKIGGCSLAARLVKIPWRESLTIGVLMNTKGLIELIILNIGYDSGVLNQTIFSIMVLNSIILTCFTSPVVSWIYPPSFYKKTDQVDNNEIELADISIPPETHYSPYLHIPRVSNIPSLVNIKNLFKVKRSSKKCFHSVGTLRSTTEYSSFAPNYQEFDDTH